MQGDGVAEVMLRSIDPCELARYQAQIAKAKATEQPVEKKQEYLKQRQKQRAKKRDRGMEM